MIGPDRDSISLGEVLTDFSDYRVACDLEAEANTRRRQLDSIIGLEVGELLEQEQLVVVDILGIPSDLNPESQPKHPVRFARTGRVAGVSWYRRMRVVAKSTRPGMGFQETGLDVVRDEVSDENPQPIFHFPLRQIKELRPSANEELPTED